MTVIRRNDKSNWLLTPAETDVLRERERQIEVLGFTAEHDDAQHHAWLPASSVLRSAAAAYVTNNKDYWPKHWPSFPRLRFQRRNLVKAAALLLAEIDRIDRANANAKSNAVPFRWVDPIVDPSMA